VESPERRASSPRACASEARRAHRVGGGLGRWLVGLSIGLLIRLSISLSISLSIVAFAGSVAAAAAAPAADASPFDVLDPALEWQIARLAFEGHDTLATRALRQVIETRPRSRLTFWRKHALFDRFVFERDLERILRLYETVGHFKAKVDFSLTSRRTATAEILSIELSIDEGAPAVVTALEVDPPDPELRPGADDDLDDAGISGAGVGGAASGDASDSGRRTRKKRRWALHVGDPFREADYQRLEAQLRAAYLDRGHASVETRRHARVRPDREGVALRYEVVPGPPARFGPITIEIEPESRAADRREAGDEGDAEGEKKVTRRARVDDRLVQRELTFSTGDAFSLSRIEESRRRIQRLDLFSSIEIDWTPDPASPEVAPVKLVLREKKPRELRVGGGYSTEELARAHIRWGSRNFLGGGRRLLFSGRYSNRVRAAELSFAQPHFFDRNNRGLFEFALFQQDEANFTRNSAQGVPAFERAFTPTLTATAGLRIETAEVRDVASEVRDRIGGARNEGTVIGPRLSLRWAPVDDVARPREGFITTFEAQYSTSLLGATYDYIRLVGEASAFQPLFDYAVVAARLKLGAAQSFGDAERLPIFERFYAGGEGSVRGYSRRQLGPTAENGNPLGGRSLVEGAVELRVPIWREVGAVGFFDFGQVSLDRYDFVPDDLRYAAGPGISYSTPIGPISLFAGFPLNEQPGEPPWQIHFNIGFFF
jgi:outer membrane protein insertion porin family